MTPRGSTPRLAPLFQDDRPARPRRPRPRRRSSPVASGRSWILLFGVMPVDYDDLGLERIEPGRGFLERSTMLTPAALGTRADYRAAGGGRLHDLRPGHLGAAPAAARAVCCGRCSAPSSAIATGCCAATSGGRPALGSRRCPSPTTSSSSSTRCRPTGPTSRSTCGSTTRAATSTPRSCSARSMPSPTRSGLALAPAGRPQLRPRGGRGDGAGVLAKLDAEGVAGEMRLREVREGRAEIVQMWGRPESVREEFRQRRSL